MLVSYIEGPKSQDTAIFAFEGRINSNNSGELEEELFKLYEEHKKDNVILDFKNIEYISSAGLRVLLKLKKKCPNVVITDVSAEVFDIFNTTGFVNLFEIKKALREIELDESKLIAKGGQGAVYRFGTDEIVKMFTDRTPFSAIEGEKNYARSAFLSGVPTAIPYDIVTYQGNYGLVFEMVKADVIAAKFQGDQKDFDEYAPQYAKLFASLKDIELDKDVFEDIKTIYSSHIDNLGDWYTEEIKDKFREFLDKIPAGNSMIHGDFHTNNVMIQGDELLIIDMAEISYGHPIFDLAATYFAHKLNPLRDPESVPRYLGIEASMAIRLWDIIVKEYFNTEDPELIEKYNQTIEGFCLFKTALFPAIFVNAKDEVKKMFVDITLKEFVPRMDRILEAVKNLPL